MSHAAMLPSAERERLDVGSLPLGAVAGVVLLVSILFVNEADFRVRDPDLAGVDWLVLLRLGVCLLCGAYGLVHLTRTWRFLASFPANLSVLFVAWAAVGTPFALNPLRAASATFTFLCVVLFAPAVLLRLGGRRAFAVTVVSLLTFIVGSWITYHFFPQLGRLPYEDATVEGVTRLGGLAHPNGTGRIAVCGGGLLLVAGVAGVVRWRIVALPLALCAATVVLTNSRTAMIAAIAAGILAAFRGASSYRKWMIVCLGAVLVSLWIGLSPGVDRLATAASRSGDPDEIFSLTGRTELWRYVLHRTAESPIVGYGYCCTSAITKETAWNAQHTHNVLLEAALGTGVLGGLLIGGMFLAQAIAAVRQPDVFPDMVLIVTVVVGISGPVLFSTFPAAHAAIWLIALHWRRMGASLNNNTLRAEGEDA